MTNNRNAITKLQLFYLISQTQIGIGIITLPHEVHKYAKGDAWLAVLAAGLVAQCMIVLYWMLCIRLPNHTLYQMLPKLWGKVVGFLVNLFYVGYFVFGTFTVIDALTEITGKWMLTLTPPTVIFFISLAVGTYLAAGPLGAIVRFCAFAMFYVIVLLFLISLGFDDIDIRYILPVGQTGVNGVLRGMNEAMFSYKGYEVLLIVFPFVAGREQGRKVLLTASAANAFTMLVYLFIVLLCTMYFSPAEIQFIPEPVLYLLSTYSIVLIQRVDLVFLAVWMGTVATTYGTYLYLATNGLASMFARRDRISVFLLLLAAGVCFALSFLPAATKKLLADSGMWLDYIGLGILPLLALLTAYIRRAGGQTER